MIIEDCGAGIHAGDLPHVFEQVPELKGHLLPHDVQPVINPVDFSIEEIVEAGRLGDEPSRTTMATRVLVLKPDFSRGGAPRRG